MTRALILLAALAVASAPAASAEQVASAQGAVLRGLDKVTGKTTDLDLRVGDTQNFGRLTVSLADCRYPVADPASNAYAQLIVLDPATEEPLFYGWMVASSPALSALDHARYDVWVLRCDIPGAEEAAEGEAPVQMELPDTRPMLRPGG
jgi:hypothetical protein